MKTLCRLIPLPLLLVSSLCAADLSVSVSDYPSIQEALNANPNEMLYVPAGEHVIKEKIRIRGERSGLFGPGKIIQENAEQPIIDIEGATAAELRDLTLTRSEGKMETNSEGIIAIKCRDLVIDNVRVIDNRTRSGAITLRDSQNCRISRCLVRNYMRVTIDDRTKSLEWGYAFNCTDGTGISVSYSTGTLIEGNRIIEEIFIPTPEIKAKHKLGDWVKKNPVKGTFINQQTWDAGYTDNWQQGSGLIVTAPEVSDLTRILGNHIENAAQGIDLHSDHVIVSNNVIVNSFMGMKAMHGSRNVIVTGNQFSKNCLWAIGMMPGAGANKDNADGGSIIANNIISDFGHGHAHWIWGDSRSPFKFDNGQQDDDPPLTDVIVQGNLLQSLGRPRYAYAVIIAGGPNTPRGMHFSNNLLHAGTQGVANVELPP
jgi:nitrous oxidase accessory protein NosD